MAKITRESIDRFFDYDVHVESRTVYIGDDGENGINSVVAERAIKALHVLGTVPEKPITIYLNSGGGCCMNGMAIYDAIKYCPCEVTVYATGSAMSMGSVILQAADVRIIYPNAIVMIHDGSLSITAEARTVFNWAESQRKWNELMYKIFAERSGKPAAFWRKKCATDYIMTAKEALAVGLVDSIFGQ